jgi:hypothetical protein
VRPRAVDWALFVLVTFEMLSGLFSLLVGRPEGRLLFYLHAGGGLALMLLLFWKFRRVVHRVTNPRNWEPATIVSILTSIVVIATIGTGLVWVIAQRPLGYPSGMNLHIFFALLLIPLYLLHMAMRWKPLRVRDVRDRRFLLRVLGVLLSGSSAWQLQQTGNRALALPGARRRFTGSREAGPPGAPFPVTNWMFDNPAPVAVASWRLRVHGAVEREIVLRYADLATLASAQEVLDCTGGWYTLQEWQGVQVQWLLEQCAPLPSAVAVSFKSVTGYRWSLPLRDARQALLATYVSGEPLTHGHGAPLRLVAPGRRGFQWVKWVEEVEVLREPDRGQWAAIFTSGLESS